MFCRNYFRSAVYEIRLQCHLNLSSSFTTRCTWTRRRRPCRSTTPGATPTPIHPCTPANSHHPNRGRRPRRHSVNTIPLKVLLETDEKCEATHGPLALDGAVVWKISKRHFFQDIKNSFHGSKTTPKLFSTDMVARGVQSFCILEGATLPLIEQWTKIF